MEVEYIKKDELGELTVSMVDTLIKASEETSARHKNEILSLVDKALARLDKKLDRVFKFIDKFRETEILFDNHIKSGKGWRIAVICTVITVLVQTITAIMFITWYSSSYVVKLENHDKIITEDIQPFVKTVEKHIIETEARRCVK